MVKMVGFFLTKYVTCTYKKNFFLIDINYTLLVLSVACQLLHQYNNYGPCMLSLKNAGEIINC